MSRDVREKYRDLFDAVDALRPGFWAMADELRNLFVRYITTCGSGERELPTQEEAGARVVASTRDAATETAVDIGREAAVQAEVKNPEQKPDSSMEDWEAPVQESPWNSPPERRSPPAPRDWPVPPSGSLSPEDPEPLQGCWNCGSRAHWSRECPHEMTGEYCFRCGNRGYTLRTCLYCRPGWLAQGPYVRGRGHQGPDPPRERRARDGARPGPY